MSENVYKHRSVKSLREELDGHLNIIEASHKKKEMDKYDFTSMCQSMYVIDELVKRLQYLISLKSDKHLKSKEVRVCTGIKPSYITTYDLDK